MKCWRMILLDKFQTLYKEDNTINNTCSRCGKCCTNILLLRETEILKIKKYMRRFQAYKPEINIFDNNKCPFLYKDNLGGNNCFIYSVRPEICRKFSCNNTLQEDLNYNGVYATNMTKTFFPDCSCDEPDLTEINKRISMLRNKMKKGGM